MKTNKYVSKAVSTITAVCLCMAVLFVPAPTVSASSADELTAQLNGISGLSATAPDSGTVNVTGSASVGTVGITLNINSGVTVNWGASLEGRATANNYLLTLSGSGTFNVNSGGSLSNTTGAGGTVYINGNVTLNVNSSGSILSPGSGSAVTVRVGTTGAAINVNSGGSIVSKPNGYAINDGGGLDLNVVNSSNTHVTVNTGGLVEAGSACAIRSTGTRSVVTITGGVVRNAAASNTNSTIYMNCDPALTPVIDNIIISGGLVETTNTGTASYVVQTSQKVKITNGEVKSIAGRAINLVGMYAEANITGGRVSTQTGTAVSTATTILDDVVFAKIAIGGDAIVEATGSGTDYSGTAVRITGANSIVTVSENAQVLAKMGLSIDAASKPGSGSGADTSPINITGGLVFGWGNAINKIISPIGKLDSVVGGTIVAWDTANGIGKYPYEENKENDLYTQPESAAQWAVNPSGTVDGIKYGIGGSMFFRPDFMNVDVIPTPAYWLTVYNGTIYSVEGVPLASGTSSYLVTAGYTVEISTQESPIISGMNPNTTPINGNHFEQWTQTGGAIITPFPTANMTTTFTMPAEDIEVTANFKPCYLFRVTGGNIVDPIVLAGSPSYAYYYEGQSVIIHKNSGMGGWETSDSGATTINIEGTGPEYTFDMPDYPLDVGAAPNAGTYIPPEVDVKHTVTVATGSGASGSSRIITTTGGNDTSLPDTSYTGYAGTGLYIEAAPPASDYVFSHWSSGGGTFDDDGSPETIFVMPYDDVTITANYVLKTFSLTVNNGSPGGTTVRFHNDIIKLVADTAPINMHFSGWSIDIGTGGFTGTDGSHMQVVDFTMPDCDVVLTAHYEYNVHEFVLTVVNGTDESGRHEGKYHLGDIVHIRADPAPEGMVFDRWVSSGGGEFANAYGIETTFTMPALNVTVTATYKMVEGFDDERRLDDVPPTGDASFLPIMTIFRRFIEANL